jgi:hypothetical protein
MSEIRFCPFLSTVQIVPEAFAAKISQVNTPQLVGKTIGSVAGFEVQGGYGYKTKLELDPETGKPVKRYELDQDGVPIRDKKTGKKIEKEPPRVPSALSVPCIRGQCQLWCGTNNDCKLGLRLEESHAQRV